MADVTMNSPTIPNIAPALNDLLLAWDASAGANGEFLISDLVTLLDTLYAKLTGATFTGTVTVSGILNALVAAPFDNGTGMGTRVQLGKNNNATPAPAYVSVQTAPVAGNYCHMWPDDAGVWRTSVGASPTSSTYPTAGTAVGAQTSSLDQKKLQQGQAAIEEVLAFVAEGAEAVKRFTYRAPTWIDETTGEEVEGVAPYAGEVFEGVVVDFAGRYGIDRDDAHPNGKALNTINVIGDLLRAVDWLVAQNTTLTARVAALEGA